MRPRYFDPFRDFDRIFGTPTVPNSSFAPSLPLDVVRHEDHVVLFFDLPGVKSDDIDLTVERSELILTASRSFAEPEGAELVRSERKHGTWTRRLHLGETLDAEGLTADYRDGVLEVTIPVTGDAKPRKVAIGGGSVEAIES